MLKRLAIVALVVSSLVTAGCLQKETLHTLYLAPDGSVEWVVAEGNVHSDEAEAGKRLMEEQAYIGPALLGTHGVARGLAALVAYTGSQVPDLLECIAVEPVQ